MGAIGDLPIPARRSLAEASRHEAGGRLKEAAALFEAVAAAHPERHDVTHQAGVVAAKRDLLPDAVALIEAATKAAPEVSHYHRSLAELYRRQSRLDEALVQAREAIALDGADAEAFYNLGVIHADRLEIDDAVDALRRALEFAPGHPGAHFELAECLLLTGRYEPGWEEFEWRFRLPGARRPTPPGAVPAWNGEPLDGPLLVMADQGFGDVIQFARFLPLAAARCSQLLVIGSREVRPFLANQHGVALCVDRWDALPPFAAHAVLSSLPRLFGTRPESIPAPIPYLHADPALAAQWRTKLDARLAPGLKRVGLVWAGRPAFGNDLGRALPLDALAPVAALESVALVSLQMGPARDQIARYGGRAPLIDLGAEIGDFNDTLAIVDGLDEVVSVDTGVAHLGGAMGRPVSILLRYAADWRWGLGRSGSPWYPTATLYRQAIPNDWSAPVRAVAERLASGPA